MRVATWNVNSIRQRSEHLLSFIKAHAPDVLCLQELKCQEDTFPRQAFEDLGYNIALQGQKTFNGVAILSKFPLEDVRIGLPGMEHDPQARYIEALIATPKNAFRIASIYAPNGNPVGTEKFPYKLDWLTKLRAHAAMLLKNEEPIVLAGDFNIIPEDIDVYDPKGWLGDALFQPESRAAYRALINLGYTEAYRSVAPAARAYTFWDYTSGAWQKDNGIRIDFAFLSPQAADLLNAVEIDKAQRSTEKPSDHVPVIVDLNA